MNRKRHQSGFALLMLLVVLMGIIAVGLSRILTTSVTQQKEQGRAENKRVLLEVKEALLSYAVNYTVLDAPDRMGRLPCPDVNAAGTEGNQDPSCGANNANAIGYFPFKSIGKGKIEDSSGECLWYVVSGEYKYRFNPPLPPNPEFGMLNWDSVGYLNLVDERGVKKHGDSEDDFPIAFIISPGASINQNRAPVGALPSCQANYTITNYLEGGPNLNYAPGNDLPTTADTLWEILTSSEAAHLSDQDYNDQVIAIYKSELWDRIKQMGDLTFDNTAGVLATTRIEKLTKSLAECIAFYGNAESDRLLPFAAKLDLGNANEQDQYRANEHYDDDDGNRAGRFPQFLDDSPSADEPNFVLDTSAAPSYCEIAGVEPYDELFWKNWKDHFFYIVSRDFDNNSSTPANATKCDTGAGGEPCISISGKTDKVAAMVVFAGEKQVGQSRVWWWDEAGSAVDIDDKGAGFNNYLEGILATANNSGAQTFDLTPTDYAYCIKYDNILFTLSAVKCADLI